MAATYRFSFPASAAGFAVTVREVSSGDTVDTGTLGAVSKPQGAVVYTVDLEGGSAYVAEVADAKTFFSSRAKGVFDFEAAVFDLLQRVDALEAP